MYKLRRSTTNLSLVSPLGAAGEEPWPVAALAEASPVLLGGMGGIGKKGAPLCCPLLPHSSQAAAQRWRVGMGLKTGGKGFGRHHIGFGEVVAE